MKGYIHAAVPKPHSLALKILEAVAKKLIMIILRATNLTKIFSQLFMNISQTNLNNGSKGMCMIKKVK